MLRLVARNWWGWGLERPGLRTVTGAASQAFPLLAHLITAKIHYFAVFCLLRLLFYVQFNISMIRRGKNFIFVNLEGANWHHVGKTLLLWYSTLLHLLAKEACIWLCEWSGYICFYFHCEYAIGFGKESYYYWVFWALPNSCFWWHILPHTVTGIIRKVSFWSNCIKESFLWKPWLLCLFYLIVVCIIWTRKSIDIIQILS